MADTHAKHHDYHLVNPSPWPAGGCCQRSSWRSARIVWMRSMATARACSASTAMALRHWRRGAHRMCLVLVARRHPRGQHGDHTPVVQLHLRYGMILFIASEVMFFVAWFWAYFDVALFPAGVHELLNTTGHLVGLTSRDQLYGGHWPPPSTAG